MTIRLPTLFAAAWLAAAGAGPALAGSPELPSPAPAPVAAEAPESPQAQVGEGATDPAAPDPAAPDRIAKLTGNMWWNQPGAIQKLGLGEAQRSRMDTIFREHMQQRRELRSPAPPEDAFRAALRAGDLDGARRVVEERSNRAAHAATLQARLTLDVLEILEPDQLQRLSTELPKLLELPWVRQVGGGDRQAQARRRALARRGLRPGQAAGAAPGAGAPPAPAPAGSADSPASPPPPQRPR